ncbi:MAG TPA: TadE/TadG family type IV pilus assembly protein [Pseudolabrys sp.]|nr:TadE/TadG family type IV pilus assembly protein [Pseudolabrys sp.]
MLRRFIYLFAGFRRQSGGNVALMFGMLAIPVIMAVGAAVDYSFANRTKAVLDGIADATSLSAVDQSALAISAGTEQKDAVKFFKAQAASLKRGTLDTVKVKVTDRSSGRTAVVNYTATVPTAFMGIIGYNTINISGSSTAASAIPTYIDFYLLLDNTPSMGVGATPTDVATMVNNTPDQCAFACHEMDISPNDYYGLAKKLGVTTRIDVVRSATQQLMDTANATQTVPNQFRAAIYTFGSSAASAGLTKIFSLSSSLSSAKTAAANIDLMTVPYQNYASDTDTDFDTVLPAIDSLIATPGDGSSSVAPQKILFFVSDGVADANTSVCSQPTSAGQDPQTGQTYTRCQEPLNVAACTAMKARGIKIAVLYTTYLALPTNGWYMSWIDPFNKGPYGPSINSQIAKNMEDCASPGFYFEVSPTDGISQAMTALFQKVVTAARITR